ncbi:MAG: hypothetical protein DMF63_00500 [Acidobacteria bacterium]|nr:MAG: hypothetical protein DMF63_00500 [Acidobacteriota bacterium]
MDTNRLGIKTRLPNSFEMRQDGFTPKSGGYFKNVRDEQNNVIAVLQASNYYNQQFFNVTFSAPKLIYSTNVETLKPSDLPFVLDTVNDIVLGNTRIEFDANAAQVMSIHFCHNFILPSDADVYRYQDEMKSLTVPYTHRDIHAKEHGVDTVYWSNDSVQRLFYPKHAETARLAKKGNVSSRYLAQSVGMLRWEHRLLNSRKVKEIAERFGCSQLASSFLPTAFEMNRQILLDDMEILGLNKTIEISGEQERLEKLKNYCGDNEVKFMKLSGLLHNCDVQGGVDNLSPKGLIKDKTLRKWIDEIKAAGISFTKPTNGRILPPLVVPEFEPDVYDFPFNKTESFSLERNSFIQMETDLVH